MTNIKHPCHFCKKREGTESIFDDEHKTYLICDECDNQQQWENVAPQCQTIQR